MIRICWARSFTTWRGFFIYIHYCMHRFYLFTQTFEERPCLGVGFIFYHLLDWQKVQGSDDALMPGCVNKQTYKCIIRQRYILSKTNRLMTTMINNFYQTIWRGINQSNNRERWRWDLYWCIYECINVSMTWYINGFMNVCKMFG